MDFYSELVQQLEDVQNNNNSLSEDVHSRDSEIQQLRDEQEEILEEMERLRDENDRLASTAYRAPPTKRVYEVGIQCDRKWDNLYCEI